MSLWKQDLRSHIFAQGMPSVEGSFLLAVLGSEYRTLTSSYVCLDIAMLHAMMIIN